VRYALLALLAEGFTHGYELKQAFERLFGPAWPPINVGQIYTTLGRLQRDGLVQSRDVEQSGRPDKRVYELTGEGRAELGGWMKAPVAGAHLKDEFFMKLVLATTAGADAIQLLDQQRDRYLQSLRDLDALAIETDAESPAQLLIEGAMLHLQADLKWLDRCEERLGDGLSWFPAAGASAKETETNGAPGDDLSATQKEA
jgi:DNA-binding PadR family transcriptional regulator